MSTEDRNSKDMVEIRRRSEAFADSRDTSAESGDALAAEIELLAAISDGTLSFDQIDEDTLRCGLETCGTDALVEAFLNADAESRLGDGRTLQTGTVSITAEPVGKPMLYLPMKRPAIYRVYGWSQNRAAWIGVAAAVVFLGAMIFVTARHRRVPVQTAAEVSLLSARAERQPTQTQMQTEPPAAVKADEDHTGRQASPSGPNVGLREQFGAQPSRLPMPTGGESAQTPDPSPPVVQPAQSPDVLGSSLALPETPSVAATRTTANNAESRPQYGVRFSSAPVAHTTGSTDGVVSVLLKKYTLTETTMDKSRITHDGVQLSLKQPGVFSFPSKGFMSVDNKVVDGKVQKQHFFVSAGCSKSHCHVLQSSEKVYVTKIESKNDGGGDMLMFTLISADNIDGGDGAERYGATISFKFGKGFLSEASPEEVEEAVEAVFASADGSSGYTNRHTASNSEPASTQPTAPVQRPAVAAVSIAGAAGGLHRAAPVTSSAHVPASPDLFIGEASSQVLQAYGEPSKIIDLGKKKTYIYKDFKIVFIDDKITDVQPL